MPLPNPTGLERKTQNSRIGMNTQHSGGRSHLFLVLVLIYKAGIHFLSFISVSQSTFALLFRLRNALEVNVPVISTYCSLAHVVVQS